MLYAIVKSGDKQFHVEIGMKIQIPLLDAKPEQQIEFNDVLLCSNGEEVVVGTPLIKNAVVNAICIGESKGDKIAVFKMKRRKDSRKKTGHRQSYTTVKITDLILPLKDLNPEPVAEENQDDIPVNEQNNTEQPVAEAAE